MKKTLKLRAVVSPTPAIIAAAYDGNGKTDACTLAFYTPTSHKPPCLTIAINATAKRKTLKSILDENGKYSLEKLNPIIYDEEHFAYRAVGSKTADAFKAGLVYKNK